MLATVESLPTWPAASDVIPVAQEAMALMVRYNLGP